MMYMECTEDAERLHRRYKEDVQTMYIDGMYRRCKHDVHRLSRGCKKDVHRTCRGCSPTVWLLAGHPNSLQRPHVVQVAAVHHSPPCSPIVTPACVPQAVLPSAPLGEQHAPRLPPTAAQTHRHWQQPCGGCQRDGVPHLAVHNVQRQQLPKGGKGGGEKERRASSRKSRRKVRRHFFLSCSPQPQIQPHPTQPANPPTQPCNVQTYC